MSASRTISAAFVDLTAFLAALRELRAAGVERFAVYSPVDLLEYEDLLPKQGSPLRWLALVAGFAGAFLGYLMCVGSALLYSLIVGGKQVVAWVPYTVVGFEATILTSALVTVGSVFLAARLYPRFPAAQYRNAYSVDQFGVSIPCDEESRKAILELLERVGASDIRET